MKRRKTPASPLGDRLRTFAAAYAAGGQRERAEGLVQAAQTVDAELAGTSTGLVEDPIVQALLTAVQAVTRAAERVTEAAADLASAAAIAGEGTPSSATVHSGPSSSSSSPPARRTRPPAASADASPVRGERRVLVAVAQHPDGVTREQLSVLTGYKRSSRDSYVQRLRVRGHVDDGERIRVTAAGRSELGATFEPLPTGSALRDYWLDRLPAGERAVLDVVLQAEGHGVSRETIGKATGYRRSSRDSYVQRLRARELVRIFDGDVIASPSLFDGQ